MVATNQQAVGNLENVLDYYHANGDCTSKRLASVAGLTPRAIRNYFNRECSPSVATLRKWFASDRIPREVKLHLAAAMLDGSGLTVAVSQRQTRIGFGFDVEGECLDVTGAGQRLIEITHRAVSDKSISEVEAVQIRAAAAAVQAEAAQVSEIVGAVAR